MADRPILFSAPMVLALLAGPNFYTVDLSDGCNINDATAVDVYHRLWDHINGEGAWARNPWIYAARFRVVRENIDYIGRAA